MRPAYVASVIVAVAGLGLFLSACEKKETPPPAPKSAPTTAASSRPTDTDLASIREFVKQQGPRAPGGLPAGHPPIDISQLPQVPGAAASHPGVVLKYTAPEDWQKEPVKSSLRVDQYRLPHVADDAEDGELAVFGTNVGGGTEANVARWRSQFTTADGQPTPDDAFTQEQFAVGGLEVTFVDIVGRYDAGLAMGGTPPEPRPDYRLLAAIVETPGGPWYFKAVGPAATMAHHRKGFLDFLHTMTVESEPSASTPAMK
jgi:hypothetical protein